MRERIRNLSERSEFLLVTVICFAYVITSSIALLLLGIQRFELSTSRVLRGVAFEVLVVLVAGWVLQVRGWQFRRLAGRLSWSSALAGVPLFICYMLLYWFTVLLVVSSFPQVAKIRPIQIIHTASPLVILVFFAINSVYEEFAVTGYVVTALESNGPAFSVTVSTLIRFLYHVYQGPLASLSSLPLGVLFGIVYWRYRTLWPLVIAHTIANLLAYAVSESRATELFAGADERPYAGAALPRLVLRDSACQVGRHVEAARRSARDVGRTQGRFVYSRPKGRPLEM